MTKSHQQLMSLNRTCGGILVSLGNAMVSEDGVTVAQMQELLRQLRQGVELCRRAIQTREKEEKEFAQ